MTIPIAKIFSLALRLFTRPLANFAKSTFKKKTEHPQGVQKALISLGQIQNRTNVKIQRLYLGVEYKEAKINPLQSDKAFDVGAELLADLFVYGTLFSWGLYEIGKATNDARNKELRYKDALRDVKTRLETVQRKNQALQENVKKMLSDLQSKRQSQVSTEPIPHPEKDSDYDGCAGSPHFRVPLLRPDSALNRSELSCLPESKSPEKQVSSKVTKDKYKPIPIENRLLLKSQATHRKLEELKEMKEKREAADVKDRPYVSRRSKALAANAEERFWSSHFPVRLQNKGKDEICDKKKPSKLSGAATLVSLKEKIKSALAFDRPSSKQPRRNLISVTHRSQNPKFPLSSANRPPSATARLKGCQHSRHASNGTDVSRTQKNYRSISPAPLRVAFEGGCNFSRLEQDYKLSSM